MSNPPTMRTLIEAAQMLGEGAITESILPAKSMWITATGEVIDSPNPEMLWHSQEAIKYFPKNSDPLGAALASIPVEIITVSR